MTKREMMVQAHAMAKQMVGNYSARIALALRQLWAAKKGERKLANREATRELTMTTTTGKTMRIVVTAKYKEKEEVLYADGDNIKTGRIEIIDLLKIKCFVDDKFVSDAGFMLVAMPGSKDHKAGIAGRIGRVALRQEAFDKVMAMVAEAQAEVRPAPAPVQRSLEEIKIEEAKATGKKVLIRKYMDDCNDPREDCDYDTVYLYAMPDGSVVEDRYHNW